MARHDVVTTDGAAGDAPSALSAEEAAAFAPLTRAIGYSRYIVLLLVVTVLIAVTAICLIAPLFTLASLWGVLRDARSGELVHHAGILKILELVILSLEAVAFYLVGIGLYHIFIAPVPLAHRLGLDSLDRLEARLISVIIAMSGVAFVGHLILGESAADVLVYGAAVALVVPTLTWFQRRLD
jgi:uncharacterized membrane protein YqhA